MLTALRRLDHWLSKEMAVCASEQSKYGHFRWVMMALEWSGHEVVCFPALVFLIAAAIPHRMSDIVDINENLEHKNPLHDELPIFLAILVGLLVEVFFVSVIKLIFKRPRPQTNHMDMQSALPGIDQYSFPSGHTSRMTMLAYLACTIYFDALYYHPYAWPVIACIIFVILIACSRVILGRHFPSDVIGGVALGIAVAQFVLYGLIPLFEWYREPIAAVLFNLKALVLFLFTSSVPAG